MIEQDAQLEALIGSLLDRTITPEQMAELSGRIRADESIADRVAELMLLSSDATELMQEQAPDTSKPVTAGRIAPATPATNRANYAIPFAIAAALLIACGVAAYFVVFSTEQSEQIEIVPARRTVATLIGSTGTVVVNDKIGNPGTEYAAGSYSIESGSAELLLTNNVGVRLRGKTRLTVRDPMHATLTQGTATFRCPSGAEGFAVELPGHTRVVDLGTEFAVHTDATGASEVYVIDGVVKLDTDDGFVAELTAGDGYSVDAEGAVAVLTRPSIIESFGSTALTLNDHEQAILDREPAGFWSMSNVESMAIDFVTDKPGRAVGVWYGELGPDAGTSSAAFDGTGAIELGRRDDLMIDAPMTFEARIWLEPGTQKPQRLFSVDRGEPGDRIGWGVAFEQVAGGFRPFFTHYRVLDYRFDAVVPAGRWVRLVYLVADDTISLYIDGDHVGTHRRTGPMLTGRATAYIGRLDDDTERFRGRIAHVAVYDRLLNQNEIEESHSHGELP